LHLFIRLADNEGIGDFSTSMQEILPDRAHEKPRADQRYV
jgi:hypothetical protein